MLRFVIPAEAGIQGNLSFLDPGFHRGDGSLGNAGNSRHMDKEVAIPDKRTNLCPTKHPWLFNFYAPSIPASIMVVLDAGSGGRRHVRYR